jgi:phosphatidylethanolamine/phosphatidyl-N-methylethanolamine N-methyltransferase
MTDEQSEKDRAYWERHAKRYDASLRILGRPLPRMLELTVEAVRGAEVVLEVAAGTGLVTAAIATAARQVVATDYADAMVRVLEQRVREIGASNVRCESADIYALKYERGSFDAVVAANVLHLVPDLSSAIVSLQRMLKPGGKLIAPTFCHVETFLSAAMSRLMALTGFPGHRRFTSASLREALEREGLQVARYESLPGLLPIGYVEAVVQS